MAINKVTVKMKSGAIEVEEFTDIPSAIEFFTVRDESGSAMIYGEPVVLQLINRRHFRNQAKTARDSKHPFSLKRLVNFTKENSEFRARLDGLLLEFGKPPLKEL